MKNLKESYSVLSRILFSRKHRHLGYQNDLLRKEIKTSKKGLRDSCLSSRRDTADELMDIEMMERKMAFNKKLRFSLLMWYFLCLIGINPKI